MPRPSSRCTCRGSAAAVGAVRRGLSGTERRPPQDNRKTVCARLEVDPVAAVPHRGLYERRAGEDTEATVCQQPIGVETCNRGNVGEGNSLQRPGRGSSLAVACTLCHRLSWRWPGQQIFSDVLTGMEGKTNLEKVKNGRLDGVGASHEREARQKRRPPETGAHRSGSSRETVSA